MSRTPLDTLLYPLRGSGPWVIGGFALLVWALLSLVGLIGAHQESAGFMAAFFVAPAVFLLSGVLVNYALVALRYTALGHDGPPSVDLPDLNPVRKAHVLAVVLIATALVGLILSAPAGSLARLLFAGCAIVLASPVITLTALNDSTLSGLNPRQQVRLARGLGADLPGLLVVGFGWFALVAALAASRMNLLAVLCGGYLFVLGHHLAGRLLFRHRLDLDLETDQSPEQSNAALWAAKRDEFRSLLVDMHRLCSTDRVDEAFARLAAYLDADQGLDEASVYLALKDFHDPRLRLEHSYHYINRLVANRDRAGAWQVLHEALLEDASFRPASDEALISMLDEATPEQAAEVEVLLEDFQRCYPDSHLRANALFRLAKVKIDHLDAREEGLRLLDRVASDHPQFAGQQRFRDYQSRQDNAAM